MPKRLSSFWNDSYSFASFPGKMKGHWLSLDVVIHFTSNVFLRVSYCYGKWNFSKVVNKLRTHFYKCIDNNININFMRRRTGRSIYSLYTIYTRNEINNFSKNNRMYDSQRPWCNKHKKRNNCSQFNCPVTLPHERKWKFNEIYNCKLFCSLLRFPWTFLCGLFFIFFKFESFMSC